MEHSLKTISPDGIPEANSKAELYRLLNEPEESESICYDVLAIQPDDQKALRILGLALTDQFDGSPSDRYQQAEAAFQQLSDSYERLYYLGLLHERRAKAQLRAGRAAHTLTVLLEQAMACYADAEKLRPVGNDDALLRWNRCVRLLQGRSDWHREPEPVETSDV